jgi:hypothetical protein
MGDAPNPVVVENRASRDASPALKKIVISAVHDVTQAEEVVRTLQENGFAKDDISVLLASRKGGIDRRERRARTLAASLPIGMAFGGVTGVVLGLLESGAGLVVGAGAMLAALEGADASIAVGTVSGALVALGIPEVEARYYEARMKRGDLLVSVQAERDGDIARAERIFTERGVKNVWSASGAEMPKPL